MHTDYEMALPAGARRGPLAGVRVRAPARLHLGFLDPAGTLGRRFGSLGLVIDGPECVLDLGRGATDSFEADVPASAALARARGHVETLRRATGCTAPVTLRLRSTLPAHAGLGSGTQLALAVGRAFSVAFGLGLGTAQLAALLGRGARSGVGIAGFDHGGLLLDGGPRADGAPAALLARIALPAAWRAILVLDPHARGLSGADEKAALARLAPLPREAAAEICHEVLMRVLPGAAGGEFAPFAAGVSRMQQVLGAHFAPAQDGRAFTSAAAGRLLDWIAAHTEAGIGQSSWGPAGFAFLPSEERAQAALAAARAAGVVAPALDILVVRARNHGALVADERAGG
ncbi:beta-ribofuranosylaminobenzene 5'-phosphate synthase [Ramlibacter monticola]|nr:beta-ribofuranosylaminobenzene 5'-phosphate synthase family protein [Ramlibacter monticola]